MAVEFNEETVQQELVSILTDMVGDRMGKLITPEGDVTEIPAIYLVEQHIPEATLPLLSISFQASNDNDGFMIDSGYIEETDPEDPTLKVDYPYYDTYLNYAISLRSEGEGSGSILREIRKKLLTPKYRLLINKNMHSSTKLISPVVRVPDLLATEYREAHITLLSFSTIDRVIDYSSGVFNTIEFDSELFRHKDDEDPIKHSGTVTTET